LFSEHFYFALNLFRNRVCVLDAIQLIDEAQHLAVAEGNDFIVSPRLGDRERQIPPCLA
jgi:hypothetical protein